MGDNMIGYVENPDIPISEVMAASAGFPFFIGPYSLKTEKYTWTPSRYAKDDWIPPDTPSLHLWDGGVYDNLGLESVYKMEDGGSLSDGVDFLIISNASSPIENLKSGVFPRNPMRILEILKDQVTALRSRDVMDFIKRTGQGMFVKIGNSAEMIASESNCSEQLKAQLVERCISTERAAQAMRYPTTLKKPNDSEIQTLFRHGYEVADCTYSCYKKQEDD
jgi:NTE family protein